jgi:hypothetical protein
MNTNMGSPRNTFNYTVKCSATKLFAATQGISWLKHKAMRIYWLDNTLVDIVKHTMIVILIWVHGSPLECCHISYSTLIKIVKLYLGPERLSDLMRESLAKDSLAPILTEPHLYALDKRRYVYYCGPLS